MKFKALVTADLHLSNSLPHAKPLPGMRGLTDRLSDQLNGLTQMSAIADKAGVRDIFILGDLWDRRLLDAVTLWKTIEVLGTFKQDIWVLGGNHDAAGTSAQAFTVEAIQAFGLQNLHYFEEWKPWSRGSLMFWPLNFAPIDRLRERLDELRKYAEEEGDSVCHVLLGHLPVKGCSVSGSYKAEDGLLPSEVLRGFDYSLLGHFHEHQSFGEDDRGEYVGAPWNLSFQFSGMDTGVAVYEFETGSKDSRLIVNRKTSSLNVPRFWQVKDLDSLPPDAKPGDYVRAVVSMTSASWVSKRADIEEKVKVNEAEGFHYSVKLDPVPVHTERLTKSPRATTEKDLGTLVDAYIDSPEVETEGLDKERLKKMGMEFIREAGDKERLKKMGMEFIREAGGEK